MGWQDIGILKYIATASFAIFFIHPWVILIARELFFATFELKLIGALAMFAVVMCLSALCAELVRRTFGRSSRYLIGWSVFLGFQIRETCPLSRNLRQVLASIASNACEPYCKTE